MKALFLDEPPKRQNAIGVSFGGLFGDLAALAAQTCHKSSRQLFLHDALLSEVEAPVLSGIEA
ncbi:MAG: hypothetical protein HY716_04795 [Planctomycetes bacterium]|nr:hypothetical protein [Planctomycetota bacterium]